MKFCGLSETSPHDSVPVLIFTSVRVYIETPLINLLKSRPKLIILTKNENKVLAKTKRCAMCVGGASYVGLSFSHWATILTDCV